jgi:hypothetical protein
MNKFIEEGVNKYASAQSRVHAGLSVTDEMVERFLNFVEPASYLSHPDVPYYGIINGDSEGQWMRRYAKAALNAALGRLERSNEEMNEQKPEVLNEAAAQSACNDGLKRLLPCPFCGSQPRREVKNYILIIECPSCVSVGFHNNVRFGCRADDAWNTRVLNV